MYNDELWAYVLHCALLRHSMAKVVTFGDLYPSERVQCVVRQICTRRKRWGGTTETSADRKCAMSSSRKCTTLATGSIAEIAKATKNRIFYVKCNFKSTV